MMYAVAPLARTTSDRMAFAMSLSLALRRRKQRADEQRDVDGGAKNQDGP